MCAEFDWTGAVPPADTLRSLGIGGSFVVLGALFWWWSPGGFRRDPSAPDPGARVLSRRQRAALASVAVVLGVVVSSLAIRHDRVTRDLIVAEIAQERVFKTSGVVTEQRRLRTRDVSFQIAGVDHWYLGSVFAPAEDWDAVGREVSIRYVVAQNRNVIVALRCP